MEQEGVATNGSAGGRAKPHAVVIPYPLQGHVIPAVHLALRLAERGFAVTFVNTESVHHQTAKALGVATADADNGGHHHDIFAGVRGASSATAGLDVRYELVSDGFPLAFDRSLNHDQYMEGVLHVLPAHVEELLRRVVVDPAATCLVADTFFVWPATLAGKLGVPYVSFWTEPALIFALYYHMDLLTKHGHFKCKEPRKDTITYIPGVPAIEPCELMSYLQDTDTNTIVHRIIFKAFEEVRGADYVICNTVEELEPSTIAALRAEKPFYAVGPIFPAGFARSAVATSMWAESDCSHWLDAQPAGSVLYISFGSYAHVTKRELHEIAGGVLASGVRFLWVMRPDIVSSDDPDPLPEGFSEAAAGRGVVVPWCCQVEVLSHRAVGGFLTHCGWNSILESVWVGVPMLCFPLLTDQFTNRRLVAREWRVGVPVGDRGAVLADEVRASQIAASDVATVPAMECDKAAMKAMKKREKEQKKAAKKAMKMKKEEKRMATLNCCKDEDSSSCSSESSDSECEGDAIRMSRCATITAPRTPSASTVFPIIVPQIPEPVALEPRQDAQISSEPANAMQCTSSSIAVVEKPMLNRIEVCMGGKCKKAGSLALLQEFEKKVGTDGAVMGCKCMGKCGLGPNVRLRSKDSAEGSVQKNPLCIGVGLEDVSTIVAGCFGDW